jgi:hypothetical protein
MSDNPKVTDQYPSLIISGYIDSLKGEPLTLLSLFICDEEYRLVHWCVKHNLSRAAIHKLFRNPTMAIVGNFTLSLALFKRLRAMSYTIGIEFWKSGNVYYI